MIEGIITGVISSFFFVGLIWIFNSIILPKMRGYLNSVPDISGDWDVRNTNNEKEIIGSALINQKGSNIKAIYTYHSSNTKVSNRRVFINKGVFKSGQLVLHFEEQGNNGYIIGAAVLKLSSNCKNLSGKNVYVHHDSGKVVSTNALLTR